MLVRHDEVLKIIDSDVDTTPFIETAHLIVSEDLAGKGLSDDRLKQIELYLAAHFVTLNQEGGGLIESRMGNSWERYSDNFGQGLLLTRYGQQAVVFDNSGTLSSLASTSKKAEFRIV